MYEGAPVIDQPAVRNLRRTYAFTVATREAEIQVRLQSWAQGEVALCQRPHQGNTPARGFILCTCLAVRWAVRETQTTGDAAFSVVPDFRRKVQVVYGRSESGNGIVSRVCMHWVYSNAGHRAILQLVLVGRKLQALNTRRHRHMAHGRQPASRMGGPDRGAGWICALSPWGKGVT